MPFSSAFYALITRLPPSAGGGTDQSHPRSSDAQSRRSDSHSHKVETMKKANSRFLSESSEQVDSQRALGKASDEGFGGAATPSLLFPVGDVR